MSTSDVATTSPAPASEATSPSVQPQGQDASAPSAPEKPVGDDAALDIIGKYVGFEAAQDAPTVAQHEAVEERQAEEDESNRRRAARAEARQGAEDREESTTASVDRWIGLDDETRGALSAMAKNLGQQPPAQNQAPASVTAPVPSPAPAKAPAQTQPLQQAPDWQLSDDTLQEIETLLSPETAKAFRTQQAFLHRAQDFMERATPILEAYAQERNDRVKSQVARYEGEAEKFVAGLRKSGVKAFDTPEARQHLNRVAAHFWTGALGRDEAKLETAFRLAASALAPDEIQKAIEKQALDTIETKARQRQGMIDRGVSGRGTQRARSEKTGDDAALDLIATGWSKHRN